MPAPGRPRGIEILRKLLFRTLLVYTLAVLAFALLRPGVRPWERAPDPSDPEPSRPTLCVPVPAAQAQRAARELRAAPQAPPPDEAGWMERLERGADALMDLRRPTCLRYYEALAAWHARTPRQLRSADWWRERSRAVAPWLVPAWLLWLAVRWAWIGPLRMPR